MTQDKAKLFLAYWDILNTAQYEPEREYRFDAELGRKHRFDFAWPGVKVAVEVDGNAWHVKGGGRHGTDSDREKLNIAASLGWRVLRFSPQQLKREPAQCIELVVKALEV